VATVPEPDAALAEAPAPEPAVAEAPPTAKAPAAPKAPKGKDKKGKDKKGKDKAPEVLGDAPSIAAHPRAARSVAQAKAWGALIGFTLGGYLSLPTHTLADAGLRALAAGAVLYVAAWAGAVFAWRRLVMIEIKAREAQVLAAVQTARERQSAGAGGQGARGRPGAGMP
jgi:hypothetical protein